MSTILITALTSNKAANPQYTFSLAIPDGRTSINWYIMGNRRCKRKYTTNEVTKISITGSTLMKFGSNGTGDGLFEQPFEGALGSEGSLSIL